MRTIGFIALSFAGVAIGASQTIAGPTQSASDVETVVTFDTPGWTENIAQGSDGAIYVTGLDDRVVWKIAPGGKAPLKLATVPGVAHVSGITATDGGLVVTAMGRTFRRPGGAADLSDIDPQILELDRNGTVKSVIHGEKGHNFNGIIPSGRGTYLTADTVAGLIWEVDLAGKRLTMWLTGDRLTGANGLKLHDGWLYVSRGARNPTQRIRTEKGRPVGIPEDAAKGVPIPDDFDIAKDGTIYFSADMDIRRVSPSGELTTIRTKVPNGAAVLVGRDGKWLYWPTRFGDQAQRLLRIAIQ